MDVGANRVQLRGKVSRVSPLKYTPFGTAICEFTIATRQEYLDKKSVGYFDVILIGKVAEERQTELRTGKQVVVGGALWSRSFRDRKGNKVCETKVIANSIEGD